MKRQEIIRQEDYNRLAKTVMWKQKEKECFGNINTGNGKYKSKRKEEKETKKEEERVLAKFWLNMKFQKKLKRFCGALKQLRGKQV